jgi:aryl-alcohol dehydrogenase-like predicted oxidoreductase
MSLSELNLFPLCLGGNVFGWTADRDASFAVLDAYAEAGGNFVDTADVYSVWVPGHVGGESETIVGEWMASRRNRDQIVVATKVGMLSTRPGLSAANIRAAVEDSLRRLGTDHIDLYWAHIDDADTPLEEALGTFDALVREGKIRNIGASNYEADRLTEALEISERDGLARYGVLQQHYYCSSTTTWWSAATRGPCAMWSPEPG